jgi:uncharacterized protein (TIGR03067 family)
MNSLLALSLLALAPITPTQDKNDDAKKIQGTWLLVSREQDGRRRTVGGEMKYTITSDRIALITQKDAGDQYRLGIDKKLKIIDLVPGDGPNKGKTLKGIYDLAGDTLRICFPNQADLPRPAEFQSSKEVMIVELKRVK